MAAEMLRQALHKARTWNKPLYIVSADIKTAFDAMRHSGMAEAQLSRGIHPGVVAAIMEEYRDLWAKISIMDMEPTDAFDFGRGGRQGGNETPQLFN